MSRTQTLPAAQSPRLAQPPLSLRRAQSADLTGALRRHVRGEVRFDDGARALHAMDLSIYRRPLIGVIIPRTVNDVLATVAECCARGVPILGRGCGTSLAGQACNRTNSSSILQTHLMESNNL